MGGLTTKGFIMYFCAVMSVATMLMLKIYTGPDGRFTDFLVGLMSSFIAVFLLELPFYIKDRNRYKYLAEPHFRVSLYNFNQTTNSFEDQTHLHTQPVVGVFETAEGRYRLEVTYGTNPLERATYDIMMNANNNDIGEGTYQYTKTNDNRLDIGIAKLVKDNARNGRIILFHENLVPSSLTKGFEILESRTEFKTKNA